MIELTKTEQEIMPLILKGLDAKKIGEITYRTEAAIKARKSKIFKKYKVKNSIELMALMIGTK